MGCTRGTPMELVGIMSTMNDLRMEKCKDTIGKQGAINVFPGSCQNGFFSLLHFVGNTSLPMKSFPVSGSPSCSWWIKEVQVGSSRSVVALAGCFPRQSPGWDGFPAPTGILLQRRAPLRPGLFPSLHTWFSTLRLQLILVEQPRGSLRDVCVFQGLFLTSEDGDRAAFPGFL